MYVYEIIDCSPHQTIEVPHVVLLTLAKLILLSAARLNIVGTVNTLNRYLLEVKCIL